MIIGVCNQIRGGDMFARYKYELRVTIVFEFGQIRDQSNVIAFNSSSGTKNSGILHTNYGWMWIDGYLDMTANLISIVFKYSTSLNQISSFKDSYHSASI